MRAKRSPVSGGAKSDRTLDFKSGCTHLEPKPNFKQVIQKESVKKLNDFSGGSWAAMDTIPSKKNLGAGGTNGNGGDKKRMGNKSMHNASALLKSDSPQPTIESLPARQAALEMQVKQFEMATMRDFKQLKEKFETQENLFSKFLKLMFEKYYHIEALIGNFSQY